MSTDKPKRNSNPAEVVKARRALIYTLIVEKKATKEEIRQAVDDAGFTVKDDMLRKDMFIVNKEIRSLTPIQNKEQILAEAIEDMKNYEKQAAQNGNHKVAADILMNRLKLQGVYQPNPRVVEQTIHQTNNTMNIGQSLTTEQLEAIPADVRKLLLQQAKNKIISLPSAER